MKTLIFNKTHNLSKLHDELLAAFPDWIEETDNGELQARHTLNGDGTTLRLSVPDETDEEAVQLVVAAHDSMLYDIINELDQDSIVSVGALSNDKFQTIIPELRFKLKKKIRQIAKNLLEPTDWFIIRNFETGASIPAEVQIHRAAVRSRSNVLTSMVDNAKTAADIQFLYETESANTSPPIHDWPKLIE